MKYCYIDIETNLSHDEIWVAVTEVDGVRVRHFDSSTLPSPTEYKYVAHYGVTFDFPRLSNLWGWHVPLENQADTFLMSKLHDPNRVGGHSLRNLGEIVCGKEDGKIEFDKELFDWGYTEEMGDYCEQDVVVLRRIHEWLMKKMEAMKFSDDCQEMEVHIRAITDWQQRNGFRLDLSRATKIWTDLCSERTTIETKLHEVFEPIVTPRFSDKQKDADGNWKQLKDNVEVFNVGSRQQIARRLESLGAKFTKRTKKTDKGGGGNIIVDETTLEPLSIKYPEAKLCLDYLTKGKRASMIEGWLKAVADDGRVYGSVDTLGAVTSRMTHSGPNLAQVEKGEVMRGNWIVEQGNKLVGIDASGLELRMLAHYMNDPDYVDLILNGDIHTANMEAAGLETRDQAKTFIYAFLYGAGDAKIGKIVGGSSAAGKRLKEEFLENTPALKALREKIARIAKQGHLPALDGRRLRVRSEHAALNTLLQGAGAIIMKRALVIGYYQLLDEGLYWKLVAQVHDELQCEVKADIAEHVGNTFVKSIIKAGEYYDMRCPLDGDMHIGDSWAETH